MLPQVDPSYGVINTREEDKMVAVAESHARYLEADLEARRVFLLSHIPEFQCAVVATRG